MIYIGWPDHDLPPRPYEVVEEDRSGSVVRARVRDGRGRQGGFMVVYDCSDHFLEKLAEKASESLGFSVVASGLRCSINGKVFRSFDYEWWPTPEFAERPGIIAKTISDLLEAMRERGEA